MWLVLFYNFVIIFGDQLKKHFVSNKKNLTYSTKLNDLQSFVSLSFFSLTEGRKWEDCEHS